MRRANWPEYRNHANSSSDIPGASNRAGFPSLFHIQANGGTDDADDDDDDAAADDDDADDDDDMVQGSG